MQKLTHTLPQIRVDETTRKTLDRAATKHRRSLTSLMQLIMEDVATMYRKTGVIFSVSKKTARKEDKN
jgi:hypothetical protein